jgi:hypothetical protein
LIIKNAFKAVATSERCILATVSKGGKRGEKGGRGPERGEFMLGKEEVKEGLGKIPHNKIVNGKFWVNLVHRKKQL